MNRSYSKIRHIQEANMLLERRRLNLILEFDKALMDKMVAETQELAKGAVGVTFGDMKVGSALVKATEAERWEINGAIKLVLYTNHGGLGANIPIGLLSDATGEVKIVTDRANGLQMISPGGVKMALEATLGATYKKILDDAVKQKPSPYATLSTVLTGIANKYKTSGLAAPTK